jgi:hypothetical protein
MSFDLYSLGHITSFCEAIEPWEPVINTVPSPMSLSNERAILFSPKVRFAKFLSVQNPVFYFSI